MNMIRNKLKEKNGASIFMGLMYLLVSLLVGTVALVAATAAAGKLAEQRKYEQDYLNVASAARLVKDRICKTSYSLELKYAKNEDGTLNSTPTERHSDLIVSAGEVILENDLRKLCEILAEKEPPGLQSELAAAKTKITISRNSAGSAGEWGIVYGLLSMETDGRIIVELWLGTDDESDVKNHNHMAIEFCPDGPVKKEKVEHKEEGGVIKDTVTVTMTCSWPESGCTITKGKQ